jgi:hypothetical protein
MGGSHHKDIKNILSTTSPSSRMGVILVQRGLGVPNAEGVGVFGLFSLGYNCFDYAPFLLYQVLGFCLLH